MNIDYSLNEFGFRQKDMDFMINFFRAHPEIEQVFIYGSRGRGDFEHGSDVDLALKGKNITFETVAKVHTALELESPTFLWFDVLHYDKLKYSKLKEQIDKYGKLIYQKD